MTEQLPADLTVTQSTGDGRIKLALDHHGRLAPLLVYTDMTGHCHVVDLTAAELAAIANDTIAICRADRNQVKTWALELAYAT